MFVHILTYNFLSLNIVEGTVEHRYSNKTLSSLISLPGLTRFKSCRIKHALKAGPSYLLRLFFLKRLLGAVESLRYSEGGEKIIYRNGTVEYQCTTFAMIPSWSLSRAAYAQKNTQYTLKYSYIFITYSSLYPNSTVLQGFLNSQFALIAFQYGKSAP
jgi:hypothetical protein